jgi:hypothetical protein
MKLDSLRAASSLDTSTERLERAITYVAKAMVALDCPQLAPILDRLETELEKFNRNEDPIGRARRVLTHANDNAPTVRRAA